MTTDTLTPHTIAELLPPVLRAALTPNGPERACVSVMDQLLQPAEQAMTTLTASIDPYTCPDRFVPMLVRWLDLDRIFQDDQAVGATPRQHRCSIPLGRVRELVSVALTCSRWRGTAHGLKLFLQTATAIDGWIINEDVCTSDGDMRAFHIQVKAPSSAATYRQLAQRIIASEKPAYVTATLKIAGLNEEDRIL